LEAFHIPGLVLADGDGRGLSTSGKFV
jgi:hypothetical protein